MKKVKKIIKYIKYKYTIYILAIIAAVYGTYGFLQNFITDFNISRIILAPIILPLYNVPA
jgi:hypothetical protein